MKQTIVLMSLAALIAACGSAPATGDVGRKHQEQAGIPGPVKVTVLDRHQL